MLRELRQADVFIATLFAVVLSDSSLFVQWVCVCVIFLSIQAFIYCSGLKKKKQNKKWEERYFKESFMYTFLFLYTWPCLILVDVFSR